MQNINLTGHKGLVGTQIKYILNTIDYCGIIDDYNDYYNFLKNNQIDTIIHAAAKVGGILDNQFNKIDYYLENSKLNNIVFEAAYKNNIKNFVNFSSTCVFPDEAPLPLKESYMHDGPPFEGNDSYAYAKRMTQHLCGEARKNGYNYFTIVPTNIFGPNDNFNVNKGHVLPALIHKCYLAKNNNTNLEVWGTGGSLKEFIYSKDLAKITKVLLNTQFNYDSIIISNSEEISVLECVEKIIKIFKFKNNIIFDKTKPEGKHRKQTDNSRLKSILPDFKFTNIDEALNETIEWFIKNYNSARK
jgi:GDP-L-fucose synthase